MDNKNNINEFINSYFKVQNTTIDHMKELLHDIKWSKHDELKTRINELEQELKNLKNTKKYWLVWDTEKEPEQVVLDCQKKLPILKEIKDKKIINDDSWESNLLIEWDNYHALQVLNYTHREAIDVIYIDPPYNTWNKDFVYNDKYIDKEDTYRHSKWLNFMEKRLKLAYDLLKDDWMIFISIDDNEQAQLKLICDEIFWEENFVTQFVWEKIHTIKALSKLFSVKHEYIMCYAKNIYNLEIRRLERTDAQLKDYKNSDNDPRWPWARWNLLSPKYTAQNDYEIEWLNWKVYKPKEWTSWRYKKDKILELMKDNRIKYEPNSLRQKLFLSERADWVAPESMLFHSEVWHTQYWTEELKEIFSDKVFDYPKPSKLIKWLIGRSIRKDSLVLDFMAWSWTTWQAVLDLNKEDWWNRKFILCTNNENNICDEITYERIKRVSCWYTGSKWNKVDWLWWNLRYYKREFVEIENLKEITDQKKLELTYNAWELLAIKEWIYNELEKNDYWQIFESNKDIVAIYFKESSRKIEEMKNRLIEIQKQKNWKVKWYIYNNPFEKTMFSDIKKLELKDIPDPILKVYREINKV